MSLSKIISLIVVSSGVVVLLALYPWRWVVRQADSSPATLSHARDQFFKSARPSSNLVRITSTAIMAPKKKKNAPRKRAGRARVDQKATKVDNLVPS